MRIVAAFNPSVIGAYALSGSQPSGNLNLQTPSGIGKFVINNRSFWDITFTFANGDTWMLLAQTSDIFVDEQPNWVVSWTSVSPFGYIAQLGANLTVFQKVVVTRYEDSEKIYGIYPVPATVNFPSTNLVNDGFAGSIYCASALGQTTASGIQVGAGLQSPAPKIGVIWHIWVSATVAFQAKLVFTNAFPSGFNTNGSTISWNESASSNGSIVAAQAIFKLKNVATTNIQTQQPDVSIAANTPFDLTFGIPIPLDIQQADTTIVLLNLSAAASNWTAAFLWGEYLQ